MSSTKKKKGKSEAKKKWISPKETIHKLNPKKWWRGISHNIHKTPHFMPGWFKKITWPHLVERSWKCPTKKQHQEEIAQAGGRRRKTHKRRRVRKRHTRRQRRRKRRRKRRYGRYKTKKKKSLTASMKQLKAWIGSTEFSKIQKG